MPTLPADARHRWLLILFFLSGFAALLYQVVWQRMLAFFTGSDTLSISLIVTAFMCGLGLGYLAGGRWADRGSPRANLLRFVAAETGILLCAAFSKPVLYDWLYHGAPVGPDERGLMFALVFGVLLVPTFLMGVSLPLLSKAMRLGGIGEQAAYVGRLYFSNTLGAAAGALLTGIVLVRALGFHHALWVGVACNAACAAGALLLGANAGGGEDRAPAPRHLGRLRLTPAWLAWSAQYALAGFAGLSLELIWFRVLETMVKSVAQTFAILLAIYLGGLAIGTYLGQRWAARLDAARRERLFLRAQWLLYAWVGLSFALLLPAVRDWAPLRYVWDYLLFYSPDLRARIVLTMYAAVPLFLMLPPTFLMGLSFSASQLIVQDRFEEVGRKLGWLQFINIAGSAAGAWCVTWIGFEAVGSAGLLKALAALAVIYAALLAARGHLPWWRAAAPAALAAAGVALLPGHEPFWRTLNGVREADRFFFHENASGLSVIKRLGDGDEQMGVVFANGLGQSSLPYATGSPHTVLGALPVLLHPRPERVAIVGLGSSSTLFAAAARPETRELQCLEIMSNQADVVRRYAEFARDSAALRTLSDPRLRLRLGDGRFLLLASDERFDVIEADALRPNSAYAGNLFSREYFQLLRARLRPGGYAVTYIATPRVRATFCSVFPHVVATELALIGSDSPIAIDWEAIGERARHPFTVAHFGRSRVDIAATLEQLKAELRALDPAAEAASSDWNHDLMPRDEFSSPYSWELVRSKVRALVE